MEPATQSMTLAKRFYLPRCVGLGLGFLALFANLATLPYGQLVLVLLIVYCFAWPHIAYLLARMNARPVDMERRSMLVDAFSAGFFAGAMGFNPIPSTAIVAMVAMNNMAMGGPRFMASGLFASGLGAALAYLALGVPFHSALTAYQIAACVPLLALYSLSLGHVCFITALKLTRQKKQSRQVSRTDHLTGLANRAALKDILDESFRTPAASLENSVIALIDVDEFKHINDTYGHSAGDRTLQKISAIMRGCVRDQDTVVRYGGDEFCLILRHVSLSDAVASLERMRLLVQQAGEDLGFEPGPTLSIGAAAYNANANTSARWIHLADEARYEAKKRGRNKVVFAV